MGVQKMRYFIYTISYFVFGGRIFRLFDICRADTGIGLNRKRIKDRKLYDLQLYTFTLSVLIYISIQQAVSSYSIYRSEEGQIDTITTNCPKSHLTYFSFSIRIVFSRIIPLAWAPWHPLTKIHLRALSLDFERCLGKY